MSGAAKVASMERYSAATGQIIIPFQLYDLLLPVFLVFYRGFTQNQRIVKLETVKEERLSITLFKDSNFTICFFCTQKHKKTRGKRTHANRKVETGYDLHPASRLSSKSGDLLRTHENKHLLASGLVACDRRHLWVDVKSDLRAPVAYTFM